MRHKSFAAFFLWALQFLVFRRQRPNALSRFFVLKISVAEKNREINPFRGETAGRERNFLKALQLARGILEFF